jgi:hypothetical protein
MIVRARDNLRYNDYLIPGKEYVVIGLDEEGFTVIDEKGQPVPFPRTCFVVVDESIPSDWVWDRTSESEFCANPIELADPDFYGHFMLANPTQEGNSMGTCAT